MRIMLSVTVALVTFCLLFLLIRIKLRQHDELVNRMEYFSGSAADFPQQNLWADKKNALRGSLRRFVRWAGTMLQKIQHSGNSLDLKMQQAGWPLLGAEFQVILLCLGVACALLVLAATLEVILALLTLIAVVIAGFVFLRVYIRRRQKAFTNQLGDMLTMVANALRAGFSFMQAFELIAKEMDAPVGDEVQRLVNEVNVGIELDVAFDHMQKRVQSPDFELVVTAVLIQRQVGGNLAQVLDTISDTINNRIRMRREVMALTAQGRASGVVLGLLPLGLCVILTALNPHYLDLLLAEPVGRVCIALAAVLELIGYLVIKKIADIKM
ncbi:MAG: type II secretion system F family protein [Selenomonas sp.]|uniref:type II secretion system F family protein n=1 Tax=Selenomonas sp. TaxID=2053611 RepID=UPI0025DC8F05|nr:type II secretion system F family protein [Selenomonas sp.]MCR5758496.1 type II secretion system F family protein [Selenomonas sp.]